MYIFNGLPSHLRIKEPSEGLRLGLEKDVGESASFYMKYKNESGVQMAKTGVEYTSNHGVQDMKKIDLLTRQSTGDRSVINFSQSLSNLRSDYKSFTGDGGNLEFGGFLATQLMQFPYEQDFEYDAIDQEPTSNQFARVNTEKIVFEDSTDVTFSRDPYGDD